MYKKILNLFVVLLTIFSIHSVVNARTFEEMGLTAEDIKYLTPAEKEEILNPTAKSSLSGIKETNNGAPTSVRVPSTDPKIGEGITSCFDYYSFGSVQADLSASVSSAVAGIPITFTGNIHNNNNYPIVQGSLIIKIFKTNGGVEKNVNGSDVVDEFTVIKDLSIKANGSVPISFDWKIPSYALSGEYKATAFFVSANKFNLLGLSFTDDVVGNSAPFNIEGKKSNVQFNKSSVLINSNVYRFAAFPPRVSKDDSVNVSALIENTTGQDEIVPVVWKVYAWDARDEKNLIEKREQSVFVKADGKERVDFVVSDTKNPVYYIVAEVKYKDFKSVLGIRFVRDGVNRTRINFPSVTSFPIQKGVENTLFSCVHGMGTDPVVPDGKLTLTLTNGSKTIHSYEYKGDVTGSMMGVKDAFVPKGNYDNFTLEARLFKGGELVDSVDMKYDCKSIDPSSCYPVSWFKIIGEVLLGLILIFLLFFFLRRKSTRAVLVTLFILGTVIVFPQKTSASGTTQWNSSGLPNLVYFWNFSGTQNFNMNDDWYWSPALESPQVTVTYEAAVTKVNGDVINSGENIPVGTQIKLQFVPHVPEHISWFGTGYSGDSPFGEWRNDAAPPLLSCAEKDYVTRSFYNNIDADIHVTLSTYVPLVVSPPVKEIMGLQNLSNCTALDNTNSMTCTVSSVGPITASFKFKPTTGKFYYRYKIIQSSLADSSLNVCSGNNIPLRQGGFKSSATTQSYTEPSGSTGLGGVLNQSGGRDLVRDLATSAYVLSIPEKTISFTFNAVPPNTPPTTPIITGTGVAMVGQSYTASFKSTDVDHDDVKYGIVWSGNGSIPQQTIPGSGYVAENTSQTASYTWNTAGTYDIKIKATDRPGGDSTWSTHRIVVSNPPAITSATCSSLAVGTIGTPVTFTSTVVGGTGPYTYVWSGTDSFSSAEQNPTKTFTTAGRKSVRFQVTDARNQTLISPVGQCEVEIFQRPVASCSVSHPDGVIGSPIRFTSTVTGGSGNYSYAWTNAFSSTASSSTQTFNSIGLKTANLVVTDTTTNVSSLVATCTSNITATPTDPVATCSASPSTVSVDQSVVFTGAVAGGEAPYFYSWNNAPATENSTKTLTYQDSGQKNVQLTVTDDNGRSSSTSCSVNVVNEPVNILPLTVSCDVNPSAQINTSIPYSSIVGGGIEPYEYVWSDGNQDIGFYSSLTRIFTTPGSKITKLRVTDSSVPAQTVTSQNCVTEVSSTPPPGLNVSCQVPQFANMGTPVSFQSFATGGTHLNSSLPSYIYTWKLNGNTTYTTQNPSASFSSLGEKIFKVQATDFVGTSALSEDCKIKVVPDVTATCSAPPRAVGSSMPFTATVAGGSGYYTYSWLGDVSGTTAIVNKVFNTVGDISAQIRVTDIATRQVVTSPVCNSYTVPISTNPVATCSVPSTASVDAPVVFTGTVVTGGAAPYFYSWNSDPATETNTLTETYQSTGEKTVTLKVTDDDGHESEVVSCSTTVTADAPGTPVILSGAANCNTGHIDLTFKSTGPVPVDTFTVYRSAGLLSPYIQVGSPVTAVLNQNATAWEGSFTDEDVQPGTSYNYKVEASNTNGSTMSSPFAVSYPLVCGGDELGVCGDAVNRPTYVTPSLELCSTGNPTSVTLSPDETKYMWSCGALGGNSTCEVPRSTMSSVSCGESNGETFSEIPTEGLCTPGILASDPTSRETLQSNGSISTSYLWSCRNLEGSAILSCSASGLTDVPPPPGCEATNTCPDNTRPRCGAQTLMTTPNESTSGLCGSASSIVSDSLAPNKVGYRWKCKLNSNTSRQTRCVASLHSAPPTRCVPTSANNYCLPSSGQVQLGVLRTFPSLVNSGDYCGVNIGYNVVGQLYDSPIVKRDENTRCELTYPQASVPTKRFSPEAGQHIEKQIVSQSSNFKLKCWQVFPNTEDMVPDSDKQINGACRINPSSVEIGLWKKFFFGIKDMGASVFDAFATFFNLK